MDEYSVPEALPMEADKGRILEAFGFGLVEGRHTSLVVQGRAPDQPCKSPSPRVVT